MQRARAARKSDVSTHARAARAEQMLGRSCNLMATILNIVSLLQAARGIGAATKGIALLCPRTCASEQASAAIHTTENLVGDALLKLCQQFG